MLAGANEVVIVSIEFRGFRILERATLELTPFNLLLGPNGSGKTTALQALLLLGQVARDRIRGEASPERRDLGGASAIFRLDSTFAGAEVTLAFAREGKPELAGEDGKEVGGALLGYLSGIHGYVLDPAALARPVLDPEARVMRPDGEGLAALLARMASEDPERWNVLLTEFRRIMPEFSSIAAGRSTMGGYSFSLVTREGKPLAPENLSQGTLAVIAMLSLALGPDRPSLLCLEEIERGIHPRLLREVRDLLCRMSYPAENASSDPPVQIVATTHSPFMLDLFGDTPEEVILAMKEDGAARFRRLDTIPELSEMLQTGRLGDLWYSGIFGGVP